MSAATIRARPGGGARATRTLTPEATLAGEGRREKRIVLLLCALAALRVFLFSAAFPFFGNVDEHSHFDLVAKYARGHVPGGLEPRDADVARLVVRVGSPEYFLQAKDLPGGILPPPPWTLPDGGASADVESRVRRAMKETNHESTQPPLYYAIAGAWYRLGKLLGLSGGPALYWVRFLNVPLYVLLVGLAHRFARTFFPDCAFLRLGVPLVVAFFPQDVFYSVSNDALLALVGGAAFFALLLVRSETKSHAFHAGTGLLVAAALLVKQSSLPLLAVALAIVALRVWRPAGAESRRTAAGKCAVLLLAAAIPVAAWSARNVLVLGEPTGSAAVMEFFGWSRKPLGAILDHPLFTPRGAATFWQETLASFWRGELVWGMQRLAWKGWDLFYSLSSLLFLLAAALAPWIARKSFPRERTTILGPSLAFFALSIAFLAAVSVRFDFGRSFYPSRIHPFLTSGRMAMGALIPFTALYLSGGLVLLPGRRADALRWIILIVLVVAMTVGEIQLSLRAFRSPYNWFHMIQRP